MTHHAPNVEELTLSDAGALRAAIETIDRNAQGIVFTVDGEGRLTGVLTDGDIRRALLRGDVSLSTPVAAVTNDSFVARPFDTSIEELVEVMSTPHIRYVPLVDSDYRLVDYASRGRLHRIPLTVPQFR